MAATPENGALPLKRKGDITVENEKMLSEKMVEYRAKHNLTQKKLAELCGITVQTVIKAEQGKPLTRLTAKKIELKIKEEE